MVEDRVRITSTHIEGGKKGDIGILKGFVNGGNGVPCAVVRIKDKYELIEAWRIEWADYTPNRKEVDESQKKIIDTACDWLRENVRNYLNGEYDGTVSKDKLIEDFRKAMNYEGQ